MKVYHFMGRLKSWPQVRIYSDSLIVENAFLSLKACEEFTEKICFDVVIWEYDLETKEKRIVVHY